MPFSAEVTLKADKISFLNKHLYYYRRYNENDENRQEVIKKRLELYEENIDIRHNVYNYVVNYKNSGSYKRTFIIYYINKIIKLYKLYYPQLPLKQKIKLYKKIRNYFKTVKKDFNVLEIKNQINYKTFKKIIKCPNIFFFNCSEYIESILYKK